jgi:Zn-dependent peptidase ImmA (M78 family)
MGVENLSVVSLAQRVVIKYSLIPPIDIKSLIQKYAELKFVHFPFDGIDGVSLNLKLPNKATKVVVNSNNPKVRIRFTLAHELGHILIPWHIGTIIDFIDQNDSRSNQEQFGYWNIESEANTFAAELLMPKLWIESLLSSNTNLADCHKQVSNECEVSPLAAAIRLVPFLQKGIVYACERDGKVEFSGKTNGTLANRLVRGVEILETNFSYCKDHFIADLDGRRLHWWQLPEKIILDTPEDERTWKEVLDNILSDISIPENQLTKFKMSINGVIAGINGTIRRTDGYSRDVLLSACIQRLVDRTDLKEFVKHKDFQIFLLKRANAFVNQD